MSSATALRIKFNSMIATRNLDQAITALAINDESTAEGMMIRVALINHIENLSPAIKAWVMDFYGEEGLDNESVDYRDAILLARDEVAA
jgi:hypothetical protein